MGFSIRAGAIVLADDTPGRVLSSSTATDQAFHQVMWSVWLFKALATLLLFYFRGDTPPYGRF